MRLSRQEFEAMLRRAKRMRGDERTAAINELRHASVYEKDDRGREVQIDCRIMDEPDDSTAADDEAVAKAVRKALDAARIKDRTRATPFPTYHTGVSMDHANLKRGNLRSFRNDASGEQKAARFGAWTLGALGHAKGKSMCEHFGLELKHVEGIDTVGGFLVPEQLESDIIDLRNQYGVFRRNARVIPMTNDITRRPRRTGGLTASFVGEAQTGTSSTKSWDNVNLVTRKLMVLAKMSSELSSDAIINIGDDLAGEIVYAFSLKEDQCGFLGDGTSTYGGIVGACSRLSNVWPSTSTTSAGAVVATGNLFSEIVLADLMAVIARCPAYARRGAKWYCSAHFNDAVFTRLALSSGGITRADIIEGSVPSFAGYAVEMSEVLPSTDTNSQIACIFGDLALAADFGDRRMTTITFSQAGTVDGVEAFTSDQILVRGVERFDINVHDVGDAANVAGPIVALRMAAS